MGVVAKTLLVSCGALLAALPVSAQPTRPAQPNTAAEGEATQQPRTRERRICRSEVETGSLARRRRRCYTQAEWDRIADGARSSSQEMVDRNMSRPPGGQ